MLPQRPGEGRVVDVAARADHGDGAAFHRQFSGEGRRQGDSAARLDHQVQLGEGEPLRRAHLVVSTNVYWGGSGPNDPLKMSAEKFEGVFRFNVSSAYELTRLCVTHMRAAGGGNAPE